jgi:cytochrome c peroxidase
VKSYHYILLGIILISLTGLIAPQVAVVPLLPETPFDYSSLNLPAHFTTNAPGSPLPTSINGTDNMPADNPITDHGATLGRVLFYDKKLSANGTISCASCHQAANGFSDPSVLSVGFDGGTTSRHSMTLINSRWYQRGRFFWDEEAVTLEEQVLMPFLDPVEMGLTLEQLEDIVSQQSYYPQLFSNAFGDNTVTSDRISRALAQFVRSIISYNSKYDVGRAQVSGPGPPFPNFTAEENLGKQLFLQTIPNGGGACFGCHTTEAFISANPGPQNNGLDLVTTDPGAGATFPNNPIFEARFKTSSLRNIELTAPYMHDGRFATLEEVVEHYNSGIQAHPTLSAALKDDNGDPVQMNFTDEEKAALVAFLKTLTDNTIASNMKFSDPFITSFTFHGGDDNLYINGENWDRQFPPPTGFEGKIYIEADCIYDATLPFSLSPDAELIISNNAIFEIK